MAKNYFLKMFAGFALFGLLASCNTTSDPTESIPNPDDGPPPKRILEKITSNANNVVQEEYNTNGGLIESAVFKDDNASVNAFYTATVTYTGKEITKINFVSSATASMKYQFDITSDSNGKVYNASCIATAPTSGNSYVSDFTFTYDAATGKLNKILEKRKVGGISAYNMFVDNTFVYVGANISKVVRSKGILDINGDPNMGTAEQSTYSFQNYDAQQSPFSTLPRTFFIMQGLMNPANFYRLSPNNPTSIYIQMPPPAPSVNTSQSYTYDKQGYPVQEKNQNILYSYKNL